MKIQDLFEVEFPKTLVYSDMEECENGINFVSSKGTNNGIVAKVIEVKDIKIYNPNIITVALKGSVLSAFLQKEKCYVAHQIAVLTPKIKLTDEQLLFYCTCINMNKLRYSYGRQADKTLKDIELPNINECNRLIGDYKVQLIKTNNNLTIQNLNIYNWKEFSIGSLFKVSGTKTTSLDSLNDIGYGEFPYITTQAVNNGVAGHFNMYTEKGNVITIDSAVLGYSSYHGKNFSASDHVEKLIPNFKMNKYIALFLVTLLNKECYKYNYGRKANQIKISKTILRLPTTPNCQPDWQYMEDYIKSLPYADRI